jgi:prepilin-type N-terminal cleavage/methylation domain-containing protein
LRTRGPGRRSGAGYSLIELLIVLAILGVIAGIAASTLSRGRSQTAAREAAERIAADLSFAQADAIARHAARVVTFDSAAERYEVGDGVGVLMEPISHRPYQVDLAVLFPGANVDLSSPDFGGAANLRFESSGAPLAGGEVRLYAGDEGWRVQVGDVTGRITIVPAPLP